MNIALIVLILIGVGGLVGLGIWVFVMISKKEEELDDKNIIINFMPQHTAPHKGYFIGAEISTTKVGNRQLIEMVPKDVKKEDIEKFKKIENVKIVGDRNKIDILPLGDASDARNIKLIWPPTPEDFPQSIKNSRFGKFLMKYVEELDIDNTEIDIIREGSKRKTKLLKKMGDGEVSEEYIEATDEMTKDLIKNVSEVKTQPKTIYPTSRTTQVS